MIFSGNGEIKETVSFSRMLLTTLYSVFRGNYKKKLLWKEFAQLSTLFMNFSNIQKCCLARVQPVGMLKSKEGGENLTLIY